MKNPQISTKGTRFRPLSLETPKPLFPVKGLKEVILIGFYQPNDSLNRFITQAQLQYLQEYTALGTAGGIYHFRDQILAGTPDYFFIMNADVCGDFPLEDMLEFHRVKPTGTFCTILGTEATRQQSLMYGCIVESKETHEIMHYVEKPETFISTIINCGIYLCSPTIFEPLEVEFKKNLEQNYNSDYLTAPCSEMIRMEQDIFVPLASSGKLYVYQTSKFWSQIKSAGAAIYANRHYLHLYKKSHPERLAKNGPGKPQVIGDVYIHPSAQVDETAVLGPNVTISKNCVLGEGVRVRESVILEGAVLQDHCCILDSIIGWNTQIGNWTRSDVQVPSEVIILNSIVLPNKELSGCYKNQIIL
ncbi:GMPAB-like protein [Mya arenaria]|uniref:GMPAB-like protein n=1 Tax=Mya arenaria TaxID=6604 RepID=A0ABY7EL32_MYAAR|nr:GMPAB-like protein [Mya arenaria]